MGCAQSKIDNEESVSRCKERRNLMKEAVVARNAFASAHSGYSMSLKDSGAALSDFAGGEVPPPPLDTAAPSDPPVAERPPPPPPPPMEPNLPPPPPPLPSFSPMPQLQRAVTMPAALSDSVSRKGKMKGVAIDEGDVYEEEEEEEEEKGRFHRRKKGVQEAQVETPIRAPPNPTTPPEIRGMAWDYFFVDNMHHNLDEVVEEGDGYMDDRNGNLNRDFDSVAGNVEFKTPEKQVGFEGIEDFKTPEETPASVPVPKFMHSNTAPPSSVSRMVAGGNVGGYNNNGVDLLKILGDIDDHFLKASQSSQAVSKMLEATRLHYHSNFADNRGDHLIFC